MCNNGIFEWVIRIWLWMNRVVWDTQRSCWMCTYGIGYIIDWQMEWSLSIRGWFIRSLWMFKCTLFAVSTVFWDISRRWLSEFCQHLGNLWIHISTGIILAFGTETVAPLDDRIPYNWKNVVTFSRDGHWIDWDSYVRWSFLLLKVFNSGPDLWEPVEYVLPSLEET
jgi:hypothetical protein